MGHSRAQRANSHERILAEAAAQIRGDGFDSVSVGKLMQSVGLTHGGFYGHFKSRTDLVAQALERALVDGEATANPSGKPQSFGQIARNYLSRAHRDARSQGCAIAALASEVGRADERNRAIMESHIDLAIANVAAALGDDGERRAMVAVSGMIGAVILARVMIDRKRSDELLRAVFEHMLKLEADGSRGDFPNAHGV
jgi:TetR/AcrR family transcriptional repressor of nem operon